MAQNNYLINTTTIATSPSGTTIASGNTQDATWTLAQTLVRGSVPAGTFLATSQTWSLHLVVSATTGNYAFRFKLQRRDSGGTMQTESGYYENTAVAVQTYDANLTWTSGTWAANDQLALVWEDYRTGGTGNKTGTLAANGSSYIVAPVPATTLNGASVISLTGTFTTASKVAAKGASTAAFSIGLTTQGRAVRFGQAAQALSASFTSQGRRTATGQSTSALTVTATSAGTVQGGGGATLYGSSVLPLSLTLTSSGRKTQYAHPLADSVDGAWTDMTGSDHLANDLDEHVIDDADYIRSELHPVNSSCRLKLEPLLNPDTTAWHQIDWRIAKDAAAGNTVNMEIRLYQGGANVLGAGTLVATRTRSNVAETFTTYHESLTAGEVSAISNYSDLFVELQATVA